MHCVWATKERRRLITPELQQRLWPYLGGIARENRMKALMVGGVEDHIHVLLSVPSTLSVAKSVQLLKGNSSKWIHDTFKEHWDFEWQEGYGAFSIGVSGIEETNACIHGQAEHHRKITFNANAAIEGRRPGFIPAWAKASLPREGCKPFYAGTSVGPGLEPKTSRGLKARSICCWVCARSGAGLSALCSRGQAFLGRCPRLV